MKFLVFLLLILFAAPAHAESISGVSKDLKAVEKTIEKSQGAAKDLTSALKSTQAELKKLDRDTRKLAEKVKDAETNMAKARRRLEEMRAERARLVKEMSALKKHITPMIRAGLDMSRKPADIHVFFGDPANADKLLTGQVALHGTAQSLQDHLVAYAVIREELTLAEKELEAEEAKFATALQSLAKDRKDLDARMKERATLAEATKGELSEKESELKALTKKRQRLLSLLTSLREEADARRAARTSKASQPKSLTTPIKKKRAPTVARGLPASGYVINRFGEMDEDSGLAARGVTIEGEPGGLVTAPRDGEVRFKGPFKGFGNLLIIEHGNGDFSLLGGLGRANVSEGQKVAKGSPVGTLSASTSAKPELYYELRRGGITPVDPM